MRTFPAFLATQSELWRLLLLILLLAVHAMFALPAYAAQQIGTVISIQPGVSVEREGQSSPLALKDYIYLNDTLRTDSTGKVQVLFGDDSAVSLASNTVFAVAEYADADTKSRFEGNLSTGLARFITGKIVENNPDSFAIKTPEALVGIRGTIFAVHRHGQNTTVYVLNVMKHGVTVNGITVPNNYSLTVPGTREPLPITEEQRQFVWKSTTVSLPATQNTAPVLGEDVAASTSPDSSLTDIPRAALVPADDILPKTGGSSGTVSGTLSAGGGGFAAGTFGFSVDFSSGTISNAWMSSGTSGTGNNFQVSGGSGTASSSGFSITGFTGNVQPAGVANFAVSATDNTYLQNLTTPLPAGGGPMSGNYNIDANAAGWANAASGTASGTVTLP